MTKAPSDSTKSNNPYYGWREDPDTCELGCESTHFYCKGCNLHYDQEFQELHAAKRCAEKWNFNGMIPVNATEDHNNPCFYFEGSHAVEHRCNCNNKTILLCKGCGLPHCRKCIKKHDAEMCIYLSFSEMFDGHYDQHLITTKVPVSSDLADKDLPLPIGLCDCCTDRKTTNVCDKCLVYLCDQCIEAEEHDQEGCEDNETRMYAVSKAKTLALKNTTHATQNGKSKIENDISTKEPTKDVIQKKASPSPKRKRIDDDNEVLSLKPYKIRRKTDGPPKPSKEGKPSYITDLKKRLSSKTPPQKTDKETLKKTKDNESSPLDKSLNLPPIVADWECINGVWTSTPSKKNIFHSSSIVKSIFAYGFCMVDVDVAINLVKELNDRTLPPKYRDADDAIYPWDIKWVVQDITPEEPLYTQMIDEDADCPYSALVYAKGSEKISSLEAYKYIRFIDNSKMEGNMVKYHSGPIEVQFPYLRTFHPKWIIATFSNEKTEY